MKKLIFIAILLVGFVSLGVSSLVNRDNKIQLQNIQLQSKQAEIKQLQIDYQKLDQKQDEIQKSKDASQSEVDKLKKEKEDLLKRQQELEAQVSAKREAQRLAQEKLNTASQNVAQAVVPVASASPNCGDNIYKQYIYHHESGCRTTAMNSIGCYGIGQSCPASKIAHCGTDFTCQDAWFSNYAIQRYGSWEGAYNFWLSHKWW